MNTYISQEAFSSESSIRHFGVKGMKWGVRRRAKRDFQRIERNKHIVYKKGETPTGKFEAHNVRNIRRSKRLAYNWNVKKTRNQLTKEGRKQLKDKTYKATLDQADSALTKRGLGRDMVENVTSHDLSTKLAKQAITTGALLIGPPVIVGAAAVRATHRKFSKVANTEL